jgi:hypothetical protein
VRLLVEAVPDLLRAARGDIYREWNCFPPSTLPDCSPTDILEQSQWLRPFLADKDSYPSRIIAGRVVIRGWREVLWLLEVPGKPKVPDEIPTLQAAKEVVDEIGCWCVAQGPVSPVTLRRGSGKKDTLADTQKKRKKYAPRNLKEFAAFRKAIERAEAKNEDQLPAALEFVENRYPKIKDPKKQKDKAKALLKQLQRARRDEKQAGAADA